MGIISGLAAAAAVVVSIRICGAAAAVVGVAEVADAIAVAVGAVVGGEVVVVRLDRLEVRQIVLHRGRGEFHVDLADGRLDLVGGFRRIE